MEHGQRGTSTLTTFSGECGSALSVFHGRDRTLSALYVAGSVAVRNPRPVGSSRQHGEPQNLGKIRHVAPPSKRPGLPSRGAVRQRLGPLEPAESPAKPLFQRCILLCCGAPYPLCAPGNRPSRPAAPIKQSTYSAQLPLALRQDHGTRVSSLIDRIGAFPGDAAWSRFKTLPDVGRVSGDTAIAS